MQVEGVRGADAKPQGSLSNPQRNARASLERAPRKKRTTNRRGGFDNDGYTNGNPDSSEGVMDANDAYICDCTVSLENERGALFVHLTLP